MEGTLAILRVVPLLPRQKPVYLHKGAAGLEDLHYEKFQPQKGRSSPREGRPELICSDQLFFLYNPSRRQSDFQFLIGGNDQYGNARIFGTDIAGFS